MVEPSFNPTPADCSDTARISAALAELIRLDGPDAVQALAIARRRITDRIHELLVPGISAATLGDPAIIDGAEHHRRTIARHGGTPPVPAALPPARPGLGLGAPLPPRCTEAPSFGRRVVDAARRLDDSWVGDLLGAVCLFGSGYIMFFAAGVLS